MASLYGHKWTSSYGDCDTDNFWFAALRSLTPDQLKIGLGRCANSGEAWPPSAPEFKAMCQPKPEDLGMPSLDRAYREACDKCHKPRTTNWSHPAVYYAGKEAGWYELKTRPQKETIPRFRVAYKALEEALMRGDTIALPEFETSSTALEWHQNGEEVTTEQKKTEIEASKQRWNELKAWARS